MSSTAPPEPEKPKSLLDKMGAALPVALTAIATAFAGMSTSELSYAMYWRSAAAQDQAKANDQWTLAGFKRDRSLIVQTTAATLQAVAGERPPASGEPTPEPALVAQIRGWMGPEKKDPPVDDSNVRDVLNGVRDRRPEAEVVAAARRVDRVKLETIIHAAEQDALVVEDAWKDEFSRLAKSSGKDTAAQRTAGQAARYEVESRRYRAEATANQWVGFLYEVRVKTSTAESDRHRTRSMNFFYAMLAGQVGATLSSLGLARRQRSLLWAVAGFAGVIALTFGAYVYLSM